ncbi:MAG: hypothetical protein A2898_03875 [Candidatus Kerfeldbacteria bacterium RIFCSPLOWO2_01_FULL_48_11]|uniref:Uncharacterized protein n=1 Tax=Candidatus Kerfeldbacteria bacterium RIFCSPLOWO2_01_FULL_48_11 TaxID=1798543 RepID=A0A1G2B758_9BACT|nr:MAG: hypothetical protein UY34_C0025G0003 [Parcubacteria group bacterium GW2011_GWA2_48_9]OGY84825.1 MAG: hypothetical protein A2898_03875 [Candidatus Kerfeldbacteria bacterium RIFCSPLOWO2_01_FULL_48_11]HCM67552.1 hypothetical protein [Candidatus Kerfeldbacteria bacterium]
MEQESQMSMKRTLDQFRNQKRMEQNRQRRGLMQRMGTGRAARFGKAGILATLLAAPPMGEGARQPGRDGQPQAANQTENYAPDPSQADEDESQFALPGEESLSPERQIEQGRKLYQKRQQARIAENTVPTQLATAPQASAAEAGASSESGAQQTVAEDVQSKEGMRSRLQKLRNEVRNNKQLAKTVSEEQNIAAIQQANVAIRNSMRAAWNSIHEGLEDAALSFVDLMIITGPIALGAFFLQLGAPLWGGSFTIRLRGVEVPLLPGFALPLLPVRGSKAIIILLCTAIVWGTVFLLFYLATHPTEALKLISALFLAQIMGIFGVVADVVK